MCGRGNKQAVKAIVSFVKIYKLLGMTNKIRGDLVNACRGQLSQKCQPVMLQEFQLLLHFGWDQKEGRVEEQHWGPEEMKQYGRYREEVEVSWQQSMMNARTPNRNKKNSNVCKTASRQMHGDVNEASNKSPLLLTVASCCSYLLEDNSNRIKMRDFCSSVRARKSPYINYESNIFLCETYCCE